MHCFVRMGHWGYWQTQNASHNANPWHNTCIPAHCHCSGMHLGRARPRLGFRWAAKCSVSCQRRRTDERSDVNCLGYNSDLAVRPSHFPSAIRAHFLPSNLRASHGLDTCVAAPGHKSLDFACHLFITYTDSVWCLTNLLLDAVIIQLWKKGREAITPETACQHSPSWDGIISLQGKRLARPHRPHPKQKDLSRFTFSRNTHPGMGF